MPTLYEKQVILDQFPPMAKVTATTPVFLYIELLRFLPSPKTRIKLCFTLKMLDSRLNLLFLPCRRMLPQCRVVTGNLIY